MHLKSQKPARQEEEGSRGICNTKTRSRITHARARKLPENTNLCSPWYQLSEMDFRWAACRTARNRFVVIGQSSHRKLTQGHRIGFSWEKASPWRHLPRWEWPMCSGGSRLSSIPFSSVVPSVQHWRNCFFLEMHQVGPALSDPARTSAWPMSRNCLPLCDSCRSRLP